MTDTHDIEGKAMSLSMYQASAPVFMRALTNLRHVLNKGEAHAVFGDVDPEMLLDARLAADMLSLISQVQLATDMARNCCSRLAGVNLQPIENTETTFDELYTRIDRTVSYIQGFSAEEIDGSESHKIVLKTATGEIHFEGRTYLLHFVTPNLFFHCSMAYAILRHTGVELGKSDYLGTN